MNVGRLRELLAQFPDSDTVEFFYSRWKTEETEEFLVLVAQEVTGPHSEGAQVLVELLKK